MRAKTLTLSRFTTLAAVSLLTLAAAVSLPTLAHQRGCDHPPLAEHQEGSRADRHIQHLSETLALTDEQLAQVKALRDSQRESMRAERKAMHEQRKSFHELAKAGASEAELKAQADTIAAQVSAHMVAKTQQMSALRALLTPEQQAKLDAMHAERVARMVERHSSGMEEE